VNLGIDAYLDAIGEELDRIVDLAEESPSLLIPAQPGRRIGDLLGDLTESLSRWEREIVGEHEAAARGDGEVAGSTVADAGDRFVEAVRVADQLGGDDGEEEATDDDDGFDPIVIARLAAVTCAVYRSDIERALGRPGRVETELAVDGVDERLDRSCASAAGWEGSMCLIALDTPEAWMLEGRRGRCTWRRGRGPAVAAVVGHASDLLLYAWGRRSPDDLTVTGDFRIARAWEGVSRPDPVD
jgi:hypothetical protein